jgi:hypothetical protein
LRTVAVGDRLSSCTLREKEACGAEVETGGCSGYRDSASSATGYRQNQGARFELRFDKSRGFRGADAKPFEALYDLRNETASWVRTEIVDDMVERVAKGMRDGKSVHEIAENVGVSKSRVERCQQKVRERQRLDE